MRFSLAVAVMLVAASMSSLAQKNSTYQVKPSNPQKVNQTGSLPAGKMAGAGSASAANARDLQSAEHQPAAKPITSSQTASKSPSQPGGKKTTTALTPAKDRTTDKNPPMNFGAASGTKKSGLTAQGPDPYKGRLRQKTHQ